MADQEDEESRPAFFANDDTDSFHILLDEDEVIYQRSTQRASFIGDQYLKGKVLGEGSYGKVKEVLDTNNLCRRAIKIMKKRRLRRIPNGEDNVKREIAIMKKLSHPNIMKLLEFFESEEKQKLYMVLEFCCCNLQELVESSPTKRLDEHHAHFYFSQLAEGVSYLHSRRVIHKDIKPSNLLVNTEKQLKITDMGVAEALDLFAPNDLITTSQGTPAYQPPEIANGEDTFWGFKVDVWSCGVTLYHIVSGKLPYEGDNIYRLFENIVKGPYDIPDNISEQLQTLIKGMLMYKGEERFSIEQVQASLWIRSRIPLTGPHIPIPARESCEDLLRKMTIQDPLECFVREIRGELSEEDCMLAYRDEELLSDIMMYDDDDVLPRPERAHSTNSNHNNCTAPPPQKGKGRKKSGCSIL